MPSNNETIIAWINVDDIKEILISDIVDNTLLRRYIFKDGSQFKESSTIKVKGLVWHFNLIQEYINRCVPKYSVLGWVCKKIGIKYNGEYDRPLEGKYTEREWLLMGKE